MLVNKDNFYATCLVFIAIAGLLFNSMFGTFAALAFLLSGVVFVASNLTNIYLHCKKNWVLFLIPLWSLTSALWSDIPSFVVRGSIQLILTTLFAVVMASRVNFVVLIRAMAIALMLAMVMSFFSSRMALNGMTGEYSLIGIFASKNFLATHSAMSIAVGLTLFFCQGSGRVTRYFGLSLVIISTLVLIKAKSTGAIFFVVLGLLASFLIYFYQNIKLKKIIRSQINLFSLVVGVSVIFFVGSGVMTGAFDEIMYSVGKDPTLTGRTYLWERGLELIAVRPITGVGSQSLFYMGNYLAEDIWEYFHVPSGAGFNFHNMYIDVSVELGLVGLFLFLALILGFFKRITSLPKVYLGSRQFFAILVFVYLFFQTFLEAGWLNQFTIAHLFVCMAWVFLEDEKEHEFKR